MSGKKLGLDKLYKNLYTTVNKNSPSTEFMNRRLTLSTGKNEGMKTDLFKKRRLTLSTPTSDTIKKAAKSVFKRSPIGRIADLTIKVGSGIGMGYSYAKEKFSKKKADFQKGDYSDIKQKNMGGIMKRSKGGGADMSTKQKAMAAKAPPPNVLDGKDFAVLRAEKAKGRGMGLQDEKLKPGKTVKASLGLLAMKKAKDKGAKGPELLSPAAMAGRFFTKGGKVMKARYGISVKNNKTNPDLRAKAIEYAQKNKGEDRVTESDIQMALKTLKGFKNKND